LLAGKMRLDRGRVAAVGLENGGYDIFFRMGWEYYVPPTCAAD
jgi:hypothetical protein